MKNFSIFTLLCVLLTFQFLPAQAPDTLWTKAFGGNSADLGNSVQQTIDGGYIIAGGTVSFGAGYSDVWLIKTDINGDTAWTKTFGRWMRDWGFDVQQTTDGGYILTGRANGGSFAYREGLLIKTDATGDTLWTKTFHEFGNYQGESVQQTTCQWTFKSLPKMDIKSLPLFSYCPSFTPS